MTDWRAQPVKNLSGTIKVPGDKSISHRSIMLGAIATGQTRVYGFLESEDCITTRRAFAAMGVNIVNQGDYILIKGAGLNGLQAPKATIDLGNSGTAMRLMSGLLAAQSFSSTLIGDASLMQRPMQRVTEPLRLMGADISTEKNGCAPIKIKPVRGLTAIEHRQSIASAQIKSALLLAGLYAQGNTIIHEPGISRDHTERLLSAFGKLLDRREAQGIRTTSLINDGKKSNALQASDIIVPSDISSAAFFMVAAAIAKDSQLTIEGVGINPTRTGIIDILRLMGADIRFDNIAKDGIEPTADVIISSSQLKGIKVPHKFIALAIDEFPAIFIAAACAQGDFVLTGAKELRVKESDRLAAMFDGLVTLGCDCELLDDGIIIHGNPENPFPNSAVTIDSLGDHRIAMAFAMSSLRSDHDTTILHCENVATSFPNFLELTASIGLCIQPTPAT